MFGRTKKRAPVEPARPVEMPEYERTWNRIALRSARHCSIRYSEYRPRSYTEFCVCGHWGYEHAVFSYGTACLKCGTDDRSSSEGE